MDFSKQRGFWHAVPGVGSVRVCGVTAFGCVADYLEMK